MKTEDLETRIEQTSAKLVELTSWFFRIVNEIDEGALDRCTPMLVRILQDWDKEAFGHPVNKDSATDMSCQTAVDVRSFWIIFKGFQKASAAERQEKIKHLKEGFFPGQLEAIEHLALGLKPTEQPRQIALFPCFRMASLSASTVKKKRTS